MTQPRAAIEPLGEFSYLVRWPDQTIVPAVLDQVQRLSRRLRAAKIPGLLDLVPAYASLGVVFEPTLEAAVREQRQAELERAMQDCLDETQAATAETATVVEIPVRYGQAFGADFSDLCQRAGMSSEQLIEAHCAPLYTVAMIGFAPGFPYLIGLDPRLHCPRHSTPRTQVAAGSVGIAGAQTGIYPHAGPGGWQLIGQTPLPLFEAADDPPSRLQPGDRVRFLPVSD